MVHLEVFELFRAYFPQHAECVTEWFPNGKNSIRVRIAVGHEFIFTYEDKNNWRFETYNYFLTN